MLGKSKILACKISGKKCEKEDDARDIIRLDSSNIQNASGKRKVLVGGNRIEKPEDILSNPDNITEQMLNTQREFIDDDISKSRRVYSITTPISSKDYRLTLEEAFAMAQKVSEEYSDYPSVFAVSKNGDILRIDMVFSNYSTSGEKLTQHFKPASMYNAFKTIKEKK